MAAYGALVSLSHTINQVLHPPLYNFIIHTQQIESLQGKVSWMIDFLEAYSSQEIADVETKIADAAYEAGDLIESNVVDQIRGDNILCEGIQTVNAKFLSIENELMKMRVAMRDLHSNGPKSATSTRPGKITMVGFDKHLNEIMGALATDESSRQIIPIVGMGGIGKTTLASAAYNSPFIVEHFHVRAWVTVPQEYSVGELFLRLLSEITKVGQNKQERSDDEIGELVYKELFGRKSDDEIGELVYKELFGWKYLIVLDDMWNMQAWEKLKMFLPRNDNGSRILVTTRLSNLADDFGSCAPYKMDFLDEGQSWDLLRKKIFAEEDCPAELEEIGKDIAKRCSGLPLALVVIGGLLAKSERAREHWESVAGDVTSALNYGYDEHLMGILLLSYIHLPLFLKPCFLYLVVFPEDFEIPVSTLVRLWVAEEFIKPANTKCLEEVAHEYLENLISRNLILVDGSGSSGKVKFCRIHDMVRDMCIIQAEKEKFLHIAKFDNPKSLPYIETKRCLSVSSTTLNRSSLGEPSKQQIIHGFRLLKVVHVNDRNIRIDIQKLINLRYVVTESLNSLKRMSLCWNLQTLVVRNHKKDRTLPAEIWQMPQLRHIKIVKMYLPDPPPADRKLIVLQNLQTLERIQDLKFTEEVLERIPNLKKLKIKYYFGSLVAGAQLGNYFCLKNIVRLHKLESLEIRGAEILWTDMAFPISLKKLCLQNCEIPFGRFVDSWFAA